MAGVLSACWGMAGGDDDAQSACPPTRVVSDVSDPASTVSGQAVNIMNSYCGACHSPSADVLAPKGPSNVADFNGMIDDGFVVDCSADRSLIIASMRSNEMPPPVTQIPVSPADLDVVVQFIEFLCTDEEKACAVSPSGSGCEDVLSARRRYRCSW